MENERDEFNVRGEAFELLNSLTGLPRFVFRIWVGEKVVLDSRDLEPSWEGVAPAYPTYEKAESAMHRCMDRMTMQYTEGTSS